MSWAVWIVLIGGCGVAALIFYMRRATRKRDLLIRRLRTSAMYEPIHSMLSALDPDRL